MAAVLTVQLEHSDIPDDHTERQVDLAAVLVPEVPAPLLFPKPDSFTCLGSTARSLTSCKNFKKGPGVVQ